MSLFGLLDFFGNIATSNAQVNSAERQQQREFQQQKDLMQMQNDFNMEMWHMNNAYNDPSAQMQRMLDAGINPDAAAQSVAGGSPSAASPVQSSNPAAPPSAISSISNAFDGLRQDFITRAYQRDYVKKQMEAIDVDNSVKLYENDRQEKYLELQVEKNMYDNNYTYAQTVQVLEMLPYLKDKTLADIKVAESMVDKYKAEIDKIQKSMQVDDATIAKLMSDVNLNDTEIEKLLSDIELNRQKSIESQAHTALVGEQVSTEQLRQYIERIEILKEEFKQQIREQTGIDYESGSMWSILGQMNPFRVLSSSIQSSKRFRAEHGLIFDSSKIDDYLGDRLNY